MLEKLFKLTEHKTSAATEILAGLTTFMTLSYIIFVQPAVLSNANMDFGAVMTATCIASAIACFFMAFLANYPIALAPAMGHNFFFTFTVCLTLGYTWQQALGANFISGAAFIILSFFGFRDMILNAVPKVLKHAIAAGIGLLITLIGFEWAGIVVAKPGVYVGLGNLRSAPVLIAIFGILVIAALMTYKVRGAILWGILAAIVAGLPFGISKYHGAVFSMPPSMAPTFFKLDILGVIRSKDFLSVIFIFFFLDLFDTIGTLIGVCSQAGLLKEGRLPRAKHALLSDAIGTTVGTLMGTSTITSYVESATGVSEGGRTGLTSVTVGVMFLLALFLSPLVKMVASGYALENGVVLYPAIAPALIIIGCIMLKSVKDIDWDNITDAIPAFFTIMIMPFTFSITEGIAFGFISYSFLKLIKNEIRKDSWIIHLFSLLFIARYIYLTY
jgi:AGZA family xanthine/uracil permease-like MFS transporter